MAVMESLATLIGRATGRPFTIDQRHPVGGGCINTTEVLEGGGQKYFVKQNDAAQLDMFEAEASGLREIIASHSVRVPQPIAHGHAEGRACLVLEYLNLGSPGSTSEAELARQLAAMHRHTQTRFGWSRNNTIGATAQINTEERDWVAFFREHRLRFQLALAAKNSLGGNLLQRGEKLLEKLPVFFANYQPLPSLLHGDLWGGNHAALRDGTPVIFDPAVYYGDREADIAMTELFGGFSPDFYEAYNEAWPLDAGYKVRKNLYNLYHVLNHYNLFGGSYSAQAGRLIDSLLAEAH
ncbi:MAG: hypothetical protein AMS22_13835 [Thiotrichales bacterium SG8_50]|nr:MAG: hypothetical protein AMS22_13835 [Thiotrichales bacterium SG8_50]